jgi:hypothetical protein
MTKNQRMAAVAPYLGATPPDAEVDAEQTAYDRNNKSIAEVLATRGPQVADKTANDPAFQPSPSRDHPLFGKSGGSSPDASYYGVAGGTPAGARGDTRPTPLVGDAATGMPTEGDDTQNIPVDLGADMATGGRPDIDPHKPGLQGQGVVDFYRSIKDFEGGKGSGTEPMEPTAYDNAK